MNQPPNAGDVYEMILERSGASAVAATPSRVAISEEWHESHHEGQLAVDVAETRDTIIVVSTLAGVDTDRIEVYVHNDLLTIRGERVSPVAREQDVKWYCQECFWGKFSRTIVLPVHVKGEMSRAEYANGILTIRIPKQNPHHHIPVMVVDE